MKARLVAAVVTAALSFAAAGPAGAQPLRHSDNHKSAPPQVTGSRLQSALLPPSAFGPDFTFSASLNAGGKLQTTRAKYHVPSMSCSAFTFSGTNDEPFPALMGKLIHRVQALYPHRK